jgi:predicted Zn-dependent protease
MPGVSKETTKKLPAAEIPYVVPAPVIDTLAKSFYYMTIEKAKKENKLLDKDSKIFKQVERVFDNLKHAAMRSKYGKTAKDFEWELNVIKDDKVKNAFAWPSGKIVVYTGILTADYCKTVAGLSAVLGHEMIHALSRHAAHRINKDVIAGLPVAGALDTEKLKPEVTASIMAGLGMGIAVGVDRPFARENELEADNEGFLLAVDAGYDPDENILFWNRMLNKTKTRIEYLSAHPSFAKRYNKLYNRMDDFRVVYSKAKEKQESTDLY